MWGTENWGEMIWGGVQMVPLMGPFGFLAMAICFVVGGCIMQSKRRSRWLTHLAATALLVVPLAAVAAVTLPNTFTNGTVADAGEINANFDALVAEVNSLTHIRGFVQLDGDGPFFGGGFTILRTGTGEYQITYDTPFSGVPTPVASVVSGSARTASISTNSATISVIRTFDTSGVSIDTDFFLLVVGP